MGRNYENSVCSQLGGYCNFIHRAACTLLTGTNDEGHLGSQLRSSNLNYLAIFLLIKVNTFASRSQEHDTANARARPSRKVFSQRIKVDFAIASERRCRGQKNAA